MMSKRNLQLVFAVLSFVLAGVLQAYGVDAQLLAAGATAIFSALAGYNTLNPKLDHLRENYSSSNDYDCGLDNCCGNPDNCKQLGDLDE